MSTLALPNGQCLAVEVIGSERGTPMVFWHGGGQTRGSWRQVANYFANKGFQCVVPDLRGHGESAPSPDGRYGLSDFADDVRGLASRLQGPAIHVGASLGGTAIALAVGEEPSVDALAVLMVDTAPRVSIAGVRRITEFMLAHDDGFADVEAAARAVDKYWPGRSNGRPAKRLLSNLRERSDGRLAWHWDPAFLVPVDEQGRHPHVDPERFEAALRRIDSPVGLIWGGSSDLVTEAAVDELVRTAPHVHLIRVEGASHMVVGDENAKFLVGVQRFLVSHGLSARTRTLKHHSAPVVFDAGRRKGEREGG